VAERQSRLVTPAEIRAAVAAVEGRRAAGVLSETTAARRINDCRRAVTPHDLWRASGGLAGDRRRGDWWDIRRTVLGLLLLLVLAALGMWLVTWTMGRAEGDGGGPVGPASMAAVASAGAPPSR
jgi:hypothetical protein